MVNMEPKQAEVMKQLHEMRNKGHFSSIEMEEESLWMEVTELLRTTILFSEAPLMRAKIMIFQNWDKVNLSYRLGGDDKSLVRQFALGYSPNRIRQLENRAIWNGYKTKYSPPDADYKTGLLEIELDLA